MQMSALRIGHNHGRNEVIPSLTANAYIKTNYNQNLS